MQTYIFLALVLCGCAIVHAETSLNDTSSNACSGQCQLNTLACSTHYESGVCPGPTDVQCCVNVAAKCTGYCDDISHPCSLGKYEPGLCPGTSSIQCCMESSSGCSCTFHQTRGSGGLQCTCNGKKVADSKSISGVSDSTPDDQCKKNIGPLPRGTWKIEYPPFSDERHPYPSYRLAPQFDPCDRDGILLHGYSGSIGCIESDQTVREFVNSNHITSLVVVR
eukprot:TRINITY_DN5981_c0_g1_i1.p1 TRINITY_DN5981_c0_g1~~TRINITY_DN5981_c0_g1_i1.p1  ORF type:complete len:222 (-),score=27.24 TRINITY_DN5981_c0_g1_i1:337-1002(-)